MCDFLECNDNSEKAKYVANKLDLHEKWLNCDGGDRAVFEAEDLSGLDLREVNLKHASFISCNLNKVCFNDSNFSYVNFSCSSMKNIIASRADFQHSNFKGAQVIYSHVDNSDFRYVNFYEGIFAHCSANCCDFTGASFATTACGYTSFTHSNLKYVDFRSAAVRMIDVKMTDLTKIKNYYRSLAIFREACRQQPIDLFTAYEWRVIGLLSVHNETFIYWDLLDERPDFRKATERVFDKLAEKGFSEWKYEFEEHNRMIDKKD